MEHRDKLGRLRRASQAAGRKGVANRAAAKAGPLMNRTPPPVLRKHGKAWWKWATAKLEAMGVLDSADSGVITLGAIAVDNLMIALNATRRGKGLMWVATAHGKKRQRHPAQMTMERAIDFLRLLYGDLGLTPTARAKFATPEEKEDDPIERILKARMGGN